MEKYLIKYRRIVEGEAVVVGKSAAQAQKILSCELACGTVPTASSENFFLETIPLTDSVVLKEVPRV